MVLFITGSFYGSFYGSSFGEKALMMFGVMFGVMFGAPFCICGVLFVVIQSSDCWIVKCIVKGLKG